jgi:hypothetical protein
MTAFLDAQKVATATLLLMPTSITDTTPVHSAEIDFNDYEGQVKIIVVSNRGTNDDEVLTPTLNTSASSGTHATLHETFDHIHGGANEAATGKLVSINVDAKDPLRYGVVTLVAGGTTPAFTPSVLIVGVLR